MSPNENAPAAEATWRRLVNEDADGSLSRYAHDAVITAEENAGMTGDEQGYKDFSPRWYEVFVSSYQLLLDIEPEAQA